MKDILEELRSIDDFEQFVADVWEAKGWDTTVTQQTRDGGIDVIATKPEKKHLIQVKQKQLDQRIAVGKVREYAGLLEQEKNVDCVEIVSTSGFTQPAQSTSKDMNVELISGQDLVDIIHETDPKLIRRFKQESDMSNETNDIPNSAHDLHNATKIAKKYTELFTNGEWGTVVEAVDNDDSWWIIFEIDADSVTEQKRMVVEKESAEITAIGSE